MTQGRVAKYSDVNHLSTELTPLSFLRRTAAATPAASAVIDGEATLSYAEFAELVQARAGGLVDAGVAAGDRVAYLMPNVAEMVVAHFAVPLAGAVLVTINTRLSADEIAWILDHSGATVLVVDAEYAHLVADVADTLQTVRAIFVAPRNSSDSQSATSVTEIAVASPIDDLRAGELSPAAAGLRWTIDDENSPIAINYTSGTTGKPKGVIYTHRGAYLNSLGQILHSGHTTSSVYLWTLPMFHCNGWCSPWALVGAGGTQVCLPEVRGEAIWTLIDRHRVTHLNGAPTVISTIMNAPTAHPMDYSLVVNTGGAPPSPTTVVRMAELGFEILHVYGLTETYGPYSICQWQESWDALSADERAAKQSRQGIGMLQTDGLRVVADDLRDGELVDVPADGETVGEIVMRGNTVMAGYFRDEAATEKAFAGGWFHSGDLGVMHPDGYVELRDRRKDVIISAAKTFPQSRLSTL